jgi:hypothetical protein
MLKSYYLSTSQRSILVYILEMQIEAHVTCIYSKKFDLKYNSYEISPNGPFKALYHEMNFLESVSKLVMGALEQERG